MRILFLLLAPALMLSACTTTGAIAPIGTAERVSAAITKAENGFRFAKILIDVAVPYLPADVGAQIRAIEDKIELALAAARTAATIAEQQRQLKLIDTSMVDLTAAAASVGVRFRTLAD